MEWEANGERERESARFGQCCEPLWKTLLFWRFRFEIQISAFVVIIFVNQIILLPKGLVNDLQQIMNLSNSWTCLIFEWMVVTAAFGQFKSSAFWHIAHSVASLTICSFLYILVEIAIVFYFQLLQMQSLAADILTVRLDLSHWP